MELDIITKACPQKRDNILKSIEAKSVPVAQPQPTKGSTLTAKKSASERDKPQALPETAQLPPTMLMPTLSSKRYLTEVIRNMHRDRVMR